MGDFSKKSSKQRYSPPGVNSFPPYPQPPPTAFPVSVATSSLPGSSAYMVSSQMDTGEINGVHSGPHHGKKPRRFGLASVCGCFRNHQSPDTAIRLVHSPPPYPSSVMPSSSTKLAQQRGNELSGGQQMNVASLITQVSPDEASTPNSPIQGTTLFQPTLDFRGLLPRPVGPLLGPQTARDAGKKTLVLDLDETLVHSSFKGDVNFAFQIKVQIEGQVHDIFVCKRPGVDEFLKKVARSYEVVIFTASLEKYAHPVMNHLDPERFCTSRLYRESCTQMFSASTGQLNYVKDLAILGRDLRHVIIVDNSPFAYSLQPENAIPIKSWFDDELDRELYELLPILEELAKVDDVPLVMRQAVSASEVNEELNGFYDPPPPR